MTRKPGLRAATQSRADAASGSREIATASAARRRTATAPSLLTALMYIRCRAASTTGATASSRRLLDRVAGQVRIGLPVDHLPCPGFAAEDHGDAKVAGLLLLRAGHHEPEVLEL